MIITITANYLHVTVRMQIPVRVAVVHDCKLNKRLADVRRATRPTWKSSRTRKAYRERNARLRVNSIALNFPTDESGLLGRVTRSVCPEEKNVLMVIRHRVRVQRSEAVASAHACGLGFAVRRGPAESGAHLRPFGAQREKNEIHLLAFARRSSRPSTTTPCVRKNTSARARPCVREATLVYRLAGRPCAAKRQTRFPNSPYYTHQCVHTYTVLITYLALLYLVLQETTYEFRLIIGVVIGWVFFSYILSSLTRSVFVSHAAADDERTSTLWSDFRRGGGGRY